MLKTTILNAAEPGSPFDSAVRELARLTAEDGTLFNLADMDIRFCTGCWSCWWKTPGRCVFSDEMEDLLRSMIASDLVLLATPVFLGLPSALMKKALDRTVPLVHPYLELIGGECHHRQRYARYPKIALYADSRGVREDFDRLDCWIRRYARNFHGPVMISLDETTPPEEVADALAGV